MSLAVPSCFGLWLYFLIRTGVAVLTPRGSDDIGHIADPDDCLAVCTLLLSGDRPAALLGPVVCSLAPRLCVYTLLARSFCPIGLVNTAGA